MSRFIFKRFTFFALLTGLSVLQACNLNPPKSMIDVQVGETFILKQPITIEPDSATQFIQFGEFTNRSSFSRFDQHCRLQIKMLSEKPQTIQPESFKIKKVRIGEEQIASNINSVMMAWANNGIQSDAQPNITANLWHGSLASSDSDSQRTETMDTVMLYLMPTAQNPNILRLVCAGALSDGSLGDAPRSYRPQREQINIILGAIGEIKP